MTQPASRLCCLPLSLVAVGLLVAGCGAQQRVVPWRAHLPLELGPPAKRNVPEISPGARPCSAAQISLRFEWGPPATGGQEGGSLSVRNVGHTTCIIGGRPELTLPA